MHSVMRHKTPSLISLPKDGEMNCKVRPPRSPRGGGGVLGLRTYGEVPLENLKSYPVLESNS